MMRYRSYSRGFTLIESLAASVLLASSVIVIVTISRAGLSRTAASGNYEYAWQYLDEQLTLMGYQGIEAAYQQGKSQGRIEREGQLFTWQAEITPQRDTALYEVRIFVRWHEGAAEREISAVTIFSGGQTPGASVL